MNKNPNIAVLSFTLIFVIIIKLLKEFGMVCQKDCEYSNKSES